MTCRYAVEVAFEDCVLGAVHFAYSRYLGFQLGFVVKLLQALTRELSGAETVVNGCFSGVTGAVVGFCRVSWLHACAGCAVVGMWYPKQGASCMLLSFFGASNHGGGT